MKISDKKEHVVLLIVMLCVLPLFLWLWLSGETEELLFVVLCTVSILRSVFMILRYWVVDEVGVTERWLCFSRRLLWSEMKYIGLWREGVYGPGQVSKTYIVCSKSCFPQNKTKDQLGHYHWPHSQTILIPHQTDHLYFEFLMYCGGERNVQT